MQLLKNTAKKFNESKFSQSMGRYGKQISQKVSNIYQDKTREKSFVEICLEKCTSNDGNIIPVAQLQEIANMSYDPTLYEDIIYFLIQSLIAYKKKKPNQVIKTLLIINYLLKHGVSACIDEFKDQVGLFNNISRYEESNSNDKNEVVQNKASHLIDLLKNREKLQYEKELALQMNLKLQGQKTERINGMGGNQGQKQSMYIQQQQQQNFQEKKDNKYVVNMQDMVQNYVYKYLDKMNENIDEISSDINQTIDAYILFLKMKYIKKNKEEEEETIDDSYLPETCIELEDNNIEENDKNFEIFKQQLIQQQQYKEQQSKKQNINLLELEPNTVKEEIKQQINEGDVVQLEDQEYNGNLINLEDDDDVSKDQEEIGGMGIYKEQEKESKFKQEVKDLIDIDQL